MSIKYYRLAKGEEMPDEFCAVRDMGGEPSEYVFYGPEAENAKLRELQAIASDMARDYDGDRRLLRKLVRDIYGEYRYLRVRFHRTYVQHEERMRAIEQRMRELGVEVDE